MANVGVLEQAYLAGPESAVVLPGTLGKVYRKGHHTVFYPVPENVTSFEIAIVLENSFNNTGLHARQLVAKNDFTYIMIRRLFDGDIYLIRAVEGEYYPGQPVFATQTDNGVFVSSSGEGCFVGWAQEEYTITKDMCSIVDDGKTVVNNVFVNLLKVRAGTRFRVSS